MRRNNRTVDINSELARVRTQLNQVTGILSRMKTDENGKVLILKSDSEFLKLQTKKEQEEKGS